MADAEVELDEGADEENRAEDGITRDIWEIAIDCA